jgi:NHLM bacteriocin system ABC transporter peptidase/ATP-binding protein
MAVKRPSSTRVKTPTVLQMEAVECGAAALSILMGYYGLIKPLEELRVSCGVSRDGSKASNIVRAAREYGFESKGCMREPEGVRKMQFPLIIFWNFNHFLVLEGFIKDKVYLNDPASGPRVVTEEEFDQAFTGVVLDIAPGPEFRPGGSKPSMLLALYRRAAGSKMAFIYLVLAGLGLAIPGLVTPVFTKIFVDNYLVGKLDSWVKPLLLGMFLTMVMRGALTWLKQYYLMRFESKLSVAESGKFLWHVLHLPVVFYGQRSAGEISGRVGINDKVAKLIARDFASSTLDLVMVVFYAMLMLFYDVFLTGIGLLTAILNIVVLRAVSRSRKDASQKLRMDAGKMIGTSMNGLMIIETLKASGGESDFFAQWSGYQAKVVNAIQNMGFSSVTLAIVPSMLTSLNTVLILSFGGLRVMDGFLTMGALVAFQSLMQSFLTPVNNLVGLGGKLQELSADMNRLDDVLRYKTDEGLKTGSRNVVASVGAPAGVTSKNKLDGNLELRNLTFGYSRLAGPLIKNFNLVMKPGSRVALVGSSGCGKSTIAKLVMGLYEPWEGEILFDGQPRSDIDRHILINSLSMVDQDINMFEGTLRDNLTMWDTTIPNAEVVRAAKDGCIHEIISGRQFGYDGKVSEGGSNFSGGQRQRLEIARALVSNPRIVVFDEATSALDPVTEMIVDDNLRRRGCTCLIVAHRLSTIRDCDEIIVLHRGEVVQRGTHDQLRDAEGLYADLIKSA